MRRIISVLSGKGGVGKTTLTVNLALALHRFEEEALAVDGDLKNPNFSMHLGIYEHDVTLHDVLDREISLIEALHIHPSGLRFIPASLSLTYLNVDSSGIKNLFDDFSGHIFIDGPPGLDKNVISVLEACDEVLLVTTPFIPDVTDCLKTIEIAHIFGKKIIGVVLNKVRGKGYEISRHEIENITNSEVIGTIPFDSNVLKALARKTPILDYKPLSPASISLNQIASRIGKRDYRPPRFVRLRRIFS